MRRMVWLILVMLLGSTGTAQDRQRVLVPVVAFNLPGLSANLWSSELHVTNPTSEVGFFEITDILPGWIEPPETWFSCEWAVPPARVVPARTSVVVGAWAEMCLAEHAVGAMVLEVTPGLVVTSRMVNHGADDPAERGTQLLSGAGQEIPGIAVDELPGAGTWLLPALAWHPFSCGRPLFSTSVGFVNPGDGPVGVVLRLRGPTVQDGDRVVIDGVVRQLPAELTIPARRWHQATILRHAAIPWGGPCLPPEVFDAELEIDGPLGLYATVVDRSSQDPRTVMPVALNRFAE